MNKTNILSFILDEVALKYRNISKNMRQRIHWMLKEREITVVKYDERAVSLNNSIKIGKEQLKTPKTIEMKRGISNYILQTQEQLDRLTTLNNKIKCESLSFNPVDPISVDSIANLTINQDNYDILSKSSFNTVKHLKLLSLSDDQIKFVLSRFKKINSLEIKESFIENIDFRPFKIPKFRFDSVSFKNQVYLPIELNELELDGCKSPNLIKTQRVKEVCFYSEDSDLKECTELFKTLRGVKLVDVDEPFYKCLSYLPSTVRIVQICGSNTDSVNFEEIFKCFPYLVDINQLAPIEALNRTKLKVIQPIMRHSEEKFKLRPRKIEVDPNNAVELNNHPELFEKVEYLIIFSYKFNFDLIPNEIKRIEICSGVDEESMTLSRFEKECE